MFLACFSWVLPTRVPWILEGVSVFGLSGIYGFCKGSMQLFLQGLG